MEFFMSNQGLLSGWKNVLDGSQADMASRPEFDDGQHWHEEPGRESRWTIFAVEAGMIPSGND